MDKPVYINKHGKAIEVTISPHALMRFKERWKAVHIGKQLPENIEELMITYFNKANRARIDKDYKKRMKKHGRDSLYFTCSPYTFVVQSATIITVELSDPCYRWLNKRLPRIEIKHVQNKTKMVGKNNPALQEAYQ